MEAPWVQTALLIFGQLVIMGGAVVTITTKITMLAAEVQMLKEAVEKHDVNFVPRTEWVVTLSGITDRLYRMEEMCQSRQRENRG